MASAMVTPSASVRANSSAGRRPVTARLPMYVDPNLNPSSSANTSTSIAKGSRRRSRFRRSTAAIATVTPSGPS